MTPDCNWDHPGAHRYTGTVAAAVVSYHLPLPTQAALIDAWERREFVDHVVIDRDAIRGQHGEYDPATRDMQFGSAGRVCDTVTRAGWAVNHVETAVVVCADGECIGVPAVCGNVFRLTRREPAAVLPAALPLERAGPVGAAEGMPVAPAPIGGADAIPASGWGVAGGGGALLAVCACCGDVSLGVIPAVVEPATWVQLAAGLAAVVLVAVRRRR